jgi:ribosomal protein L9
MVYIEIIAYTTYCIAFSIACFLVLKKLYNKKLEELEQHHRESIKELEKWAKDIRTKQDKSIISAKDAVSKENKLYLSQMNKDISAKIKNLANIVKNRPII